MDDIVFRDGMAICIKDTEDGEKEFPVETLLPYLNCTVKFETVTTLEQVWAYLEHDALIFGVIFAQAMGNHDISSFIKQFKKPARENEDEDTDNCMTELVLGWDGDVWEGKITITTDFDGYGPQKDLDGQGFEGKWGIDLSPVNDLKHYPLRLDEDITIRVRQPYEVIWEGRQEWTVYDMFFGILFEITFHGTPNDQIGRLADLDQRMAEGKDIVKDMDERGEL